MKSYVHDGLSGDQRDLHDSGIAITNDELKALGVLAYHFTEQEGVDRLAAERGYKNRDVISVSPNTMGDAYNEKLKQFYAEHLHEDEEIRYVLEGEGFFDVRDKDERWIRCRLSKGDLLILPEGIYHRFTPSSTDYIKAMRLFQDEPKWVAHPRTPESDAVSARSQYLAAIGA